MQEQSKQKGGAGSSDHQQYRAPEGQGNARDTTEGHVENSIFDGRGNETVVVTTTDEDGNVVQGTGATSEEALKDAKKGGKALGEGFYDHKL